MRKEDKKVDNFILNFLCALFLVLGFQLVIYLIPTQYLYVNPKLVLGTIESEAIAIVLLSAAIIISIYLLKTATRYQTLITILLAGLMSNLYDRIFRGGVIDYIYIRGFPMFNIPDIVIVVTIALLTISNFYKLKNAV